MLKISLRQNSPQALKEIGKKVNNLTTSLFATLRAMDASMVCHIV
jgi:hypothetical protein